MGIQYDAQKTQREAPVWIQPPTPVVRESDCSEARRYEHSVGHSTWLWPTFVSLWIAGVFVAFVIIRVLGSNTAASIFHALAGH
jgi:hypothetical protein